MKHEFLVVSKSMFTADGMPIPCNDKSMLLSTLEEYVEYKLTPPLKPQVSAVESSYIIIDAYMAIVNKIQIEKSHNKIRSVQDFADNFVKRVEAETSEFKRVLLVFDRYDFPMSLKSLTREQRTEGQQVHFKLTTNTEIGKIKTKMLLSYTKTKVTFTQILTETTEARFKSSTSASYTIIYMEKRFFKHGYCRRSL